MKKYLAAALTFALASCLSGCGSSSSSSSPAVSPSTTTAAASAAAANAENENASGAFTTDDNGYKHYATPEDATDFTGVDFSAPDIIISYGDFDKMLETSKSIQNYQLEGVVVEIDGIVNSGLSHSIEIPSDDKSMSVGTTMQVVGFSDSDYPEDKTKVHIVGIVRPINEYAHGIFVAKDNFKVVE